jgi:lysozyme family protein
MSKPKYDAEFNKLRWANCKVTPSRLVEVTKTARWIVANRNHYEIVQKNTGVPWWFIGCLHVREAGATASAFKTYLGNGEPLNRVTRLVPAGRGPFATWEDGACDALRIQKFDKITDWSVEHSLYLAEEYNGFGYASKGLPSPYVWGATNYQKPGKYVKDGVFDASVTDTQIGVAAMLQIISALVGGILPGLVGNIIKSSTPTAGVNVGAAGATTNIGNVIIGAIMAGLGASGFGVDAIHTISTIAGVLVTVLSAINHMGVIGASNANTEALIEQLLTQIANYQPPVPIPDIVVEPEPSDESAPKGA